MELIELLEFKELFKSVDTLDPRSLRRWFGKYSELTINEHCQITGRSPGAICRWRKRADIVKVTFVELDDRVITQRLKPPPYRPPSIPWPNMDTPDDWDSHPEWVAGHLDDGISLRRLSKILGCSRHKIRRLARDAKQSQMPKYILDFIHAL